MFLLGVIDPASGSVFHDIWHFKTFGILWQLTFRDIWHFMTFDIWHLKFHEILHFMTFDILWLLTFSDIWHFMTFYILWHLTFNISWHLTFDISWQLIFHDIWHFTTLDISWLIPDICHRHDGRCPCKKIPSGVKNFRFNAKTSYDILFQRHFYCFWMVLIVFWG